MATKLFLDLQLFAEGGTASGGDGAASVSTGGEGSGETTTDAVSGAEGEAANERAEAYKRFRADFEQEFKAETQDIVQKRIKNANAQINNLNAYRSKVEPMIATLAGLYECDANDLDTLYERFKEDNRYYEDEAIEKGTSVDFIRELKNTQMERDALRRQAEAKQRMETERQIHEKLTADVENLKAIYPTFDFEAEILNPDFQRLIKNGVPMQSAYEVIHRDEILSKAMYITAQKTEGKIASAVAANQKRPSENGTSGTAAAVSKIDVNSLTKEQMADLKARAARGEKISF